MIDGKKLPFAIFSINVFVSGGNLKGTTSFLGIVFKNNNKCRDNDKNKDQGKEHQSDYINT